MMHFDFTIQKKGMCVSPKKEKENQVILISGKNGYVVMGGTSVPVYQKLIDKTKDLHLKANSCCQKIDKKLTLGI